MRIAMIFDVESSAGIRARHHNEWRDRRFEPPGIALYGAQKVAKAKLPVMYYSA
jgi:hypothetical protein